MRSETVRFVDHVVRQGDAKLSTLLSADYSFVDDSLARIYGLPAPATPWEQTTLPAERAGILTHASLLTAQSHAADVSWVLRGKFVREQLLCELIAPPPPDVDMNTANDPDRLKADACKGCHLLMDPIGYGFDGFNAIGEAVSATTAGEINDAGDTEVAGRVRRRWRARRQARRQRPGGRVLRAPVVPLCHAQARSRSRSLLGRSGARYLR